MRAVGVPIHTLTGIPLNNELRKSQTYDFLGNSDGIGKRIAPPVWGLWGSKIIEYDYLGIVKRPLLVDIVTIFQALIAKTEFQRVYV